MFFNKFKREKMKKIKEKIKRLREWWEKSKRKTLIEQFAITDDFAKQEKILNKILALNPTRKELWILARGARNQLLQNKLDKMILANNPDENELFFLLILSNDETIFKEALELWEIKQMDKKIWMVVLFNVNNRENAWEMMRRLESYFNLEDVDLYMIVRNAKVEEIACYAFLKIFGERGISFPIIEEVNSDGSEGSEGGVVN